MEASPNRCEARVGGFLERNWGLLPWGTVGDGLRGYFLGKDDIILTSISGATGEGSYLHVIDYTADLLRDRAGP